MSAPVMDESQLLRILLAASNAAAKNGGAGLDLTDIGNAFEPEDPPARDFLDDAVRLLEQRGLLTAFHSGAGLNGIHLQPQGRSLAAKLELARRDPVARLKQLQDDYLRWVYLTTEVEERRPTATEFLTTDTSYNGIPYSAQELLRAGVRLKERGFIEGEGRYSYAAPAQPKVTAFGRSVVEQGRSVHDVVEEPTSQPSSQQFFTTVHGNANVANGGSDVVQTLNIAPDWAEHVERVVAAVVQALDSLPPGTAGPLRPLLDEARIAVEERSPSRAQRALRAVGAFLTDTSSGVLGGMLGAQALALLPMLG